jgi:hypothetical protein
MEGALVERLARDAEGGPGVLPYLQVTLSELWKARQERNLGRYLPLALYEALHGKDGVGPLARTLARKAERALRS